MDIPTTENVKLKTQPKLAVEDLIIIMKTYISRSYVMLWWRIPFFRSARASWNTFVSLSVSPSSRKIWITYIQACMPHESSEDSSNQPDGPMGSPKCSPWPPGTPRPPPSTPNDSKTGLLFSLNSSDHLACFSNHQMTHQMSLLILWDILPLPLWSVQSSTAPSLETLRRFAPKSRVDLADLSSPVWSCSKSCIQSWITVPATLQH